MPVLLDRFLPTPSGDCLFIQQPETLKEVVCVFDLISRTEAILGYWLFL